MTAPTVVSVIPDQQDAPSVAISPFDTSVFFTDLEESNSLSYSFSGFPGSSGLSGDTETGEITGTPNSNDMAGSYTVTVTATDEDGNSNSIGVDFIVAEDPDPPDPEPDPGDAHFFVDFATGNDGNAGTAGAPWKTPNKAVSATALGGGQTIVEFAPGEYTLGGGFTISNSGTSGNEIVWRAGSDGDVVFTAPPGQTIGTMMTFASGLQHFIMQRSANRRFVVDGKVIFGNGGGEIQRGDDPSSIARVRIAAVFDGGANCDVGFHVMRCSDWNGVRVGHSSGTLRLRLSSDQHGTPVLVTTNSSGNTVIQDKADTYSVNTSGTARTIIDGGDLGLRIDRGGHGGGECRAGELSVRLIAGNGIWGGFIDTFSAGPPEGNRAFTGPFKNARYNYFYDVVIDGSGKAGDQPAQEGIKLEGRDNVMINGYSRRPHWNHIETARASWSSYAANLRVGHWVFDTCPGPIWEMRDYGNGSGDGKISNSSHQAVPFGPHELKNFISIEPATDSDRFIDAVFATGDWEDQLRAVQGGTIVMASRDFSDLTVRLLGGGGPGSVNMTAALGLAEGVFDDIELRTAANLPNLPSSSEDTDPSDLINVLALSGGDTFSRGQGVALTTIAASDPGSGTTVHLNDARWLPDPNDGVGEAGSFQQFQFFCQGANRTYTAKNKGLNQVTVSAGFSRSPGDPVHLRIPSGSSPHRGYSHQT